MTKIYAVCYDDHEESFIEKVFQNESDAISFAKEKNKERGLLGKAYAVEEEELY